MDKLDQQRPERTLLRGAEMRPREPAQYGAGLDDYAARMIAAARPQAGDGCTPFACAAYRRWIMRAFELDQARKDRDATRH